VRCGEDLEVVGSPRHHALLAVGGFGVLHDDEAEVSRIFPVVRGLAAAHRRSLRQR